MYADMHVSGARTTAFGSIELALIGKIILPQMDKRKQWMPNG